MRFIFLSAAVVILGCESTTVVTPPPPPACSTGGAGGAGSGDGAGGVPADGLCQPDLVHCPINFDQFCDAQPGAFLTYCCMDTIVSQACATRKGILSHHCKGCEGSGDVNTGYFNDVACAISPKTGVVTCEAVAEAAACSSP